LSIETCGKENKFFHHQEALKQSRHASAIAPVGNLFLSFLLRLMSRRNVRAQSSGDRAVPNTALARA